MPTPTTPTNAETAADRSARHRALLSSAVDSSVDYRGLRDHVADLVEAAGYRMPRAVADMGGIDMITGDARALVAFRRGSGEWVAITSTGRDDADQVAYTGSRERFAAILAAVIIDAAE